MSEQIEQWLRNLSRLPDTDAGDWLALDIAREDRLLDEDGLLAALAGEGPMSGWHQETGGVSIYRNREVSPGQKLLSGEWFSDRACIQAVYAGGNRWQFRRIRLEAGGTSAANGLAQKVRHLRTDGKGTLHYYRLWQADMDGAPCVTASVLIDFNET